MLVQQSLLASPCQTTNRSAKIEKETAASNRYGVRVLYFTYVLIFNRRMLELLRDMGIPLLSN